MSKLSIIGQPSATFGVVYSNARRFCADWYLSALYALWLAGTFTPVDPVVLAAQCALETNWGRFGGAVGPKWNNTCGLKHASATGDTPEDHARFSTLYMGAMAHAQHLCAYARVPREMLEPIVDPRFGLITGSPVLFVEDLSGRWAPGADYGTAIRGIHDRLVDNG